MVSKSPTMPPKSRVATAWSTTSAVNSWVDLQGVDAEPKQVAQGGLAGAEVVEATLTPSARKASVCRAVAPLLVMIEVSVSSTCTG